MNDYVMNHNIEKPKNVYLGNNPHIATNQLVQVCFYIKLLKSCILMINNF